MLHLLHNAKNNMHANDWQLVYQQIWIKTMLNPRYWQHHLNLELNVFVQWSRRWISYGIQTWFLPWRRFLSSFTVSVCHVSVSSGCHRFVWSLHATQLQNRSRLLTFSPAHDAVFRHFVSAYTLIHLAVAKSSRYSTLWYSYHPWLEQYGFWSPHLSWK